MHGQILFHLDNPDPNPVEKKKVIQSKSKKIQISGQIGFQNPDLVHHCFAPTKRASVSNLSF